VRHGRGFRYLDENGEPIGDRELLERIRGLAIPPAWKEVWICPDPRGHIQARDRERIELAVLKLLG
jgi:DNA topoisomerase I